MLRRLTAAEWRSACVAGLFALHPLQLESVAWVAERKGVLSGFFCVLVRQRDRGSGVGWLLVLYTLHDS